MNNLTNVLKDPKVEAAMKRFDKHWRNTVATAAQAFADCVETMPDCANWWNGNHAIKAISNKTIILERLCDILHR